MSAHSSDGAERPDAAFALLHELKHFVAQAHLKSTPNHIGTLHRFHDGSYIAPTDSDVFKDQRVSEFIRRSAKLIDVLAEAGRLRTGPAGASVDGVGLERILIAYELASRYSEQDNTEWQTGSSEWLQDISNILSFFSQMAQRRYEKSSAQMTVAYYPHSAPAGIPYGQLGKPLLDEYKALLRLCRDAHTVLVVHRACVISDLITGSPSKDVGRDIFDIPPIPLRLEHLRDLPSQHGVPPVVFNLNTNGSMEILARSELAFRRVNNIWRYTNLRGALNAIKTELNTVASDNSLIAHNFLALALDLADRGEGALPFLCDEPSTEILNELLDSQDGVIRGLTGLPYQELAARTRFSYLVGRQELSLGKAPYRQLSSLLRDVCSIDGATVFSYKGDLLGFGCIVKLSASLEAKRIAPRQEGARSAAAKAISRHGIAIKVSTDGDATLFLRDVGEWGTFC